MRLVMQVTLAVVALGLATPGGAAEPSRPTAGSSQVSELMTRSQRYPGFNKLGRGAGNVFTGWLEIPLAIQERYTNQDPVTTFVTGTSVGLVKGVTRTLVGVYEVATFFIPYPQQYAPILPPLEYFSRPPPKWR